MKEFNEETREIIIHELMGIITDIKNGATIHKFNLDKNGDFYILHAAIIPKPLPVPKYIPNELVNYLINPEKSTPEKNYADCSQCEHHNYDWFDDGDEF